MLSTKKIIHLVIALNLFQVLQAQELNTNINQYLNEYIKCNDFSGAILISKKGNIIYEDSFGYANKELQVKNTLNTKFNLASVSKQFTAVAIMQLIQDEKLKLDQTIDTFFPKIPKSNLITIKMLLNHSSGLQIDFDELYLKYADIDSTNVFKTIEEKTLLFPPGESIAYSNIGYFLLAKIVEKISGLEFEDFLKKRIFKYADMNHSGVCNNDSIIKNLASYYYKSEDGFKKNPFINWKYNIGHDGIYSTIEDLYSWNNTLFKSEKILLNDFKNLMIGTYNDQNFGFGYVINPFYSHNEKFIGHDGMFFGSITSYNYFPEKDIFIVVLSNNQSPSYLLAYALSAIMLGKDVKTPYKHNKIELDFISIKKYEGSYGKIKFFEENGVLYYQNSNIRLVPESKTKFFRESDPNITYKFVTDKYGVVKKVIISKYGVEEIINK
ncbi:class A beta-lactamase-related serine hydrolase [Flavobacterium piscinae]|uniref:Class A beta-lactamase-related serine hydrolase n=1 Tax=Flavobacterium piscinae TaxID=2506424 RepID=A0A4Q1KWS8_9FLAO|nr:serine hydrolase domain-containing protein [Flavobacterium piscinae]RXR34781.1 class A beta-lactamase-related serine hydrolase [Flavobacterium piscinae]